MKPTNRIARQSASVKSKAKLLIEILVVLGTMSGTKAILDQFQIIGSGSIGIWAGIIVATFVLKKRKIKCGIPTKKWTN